MASLTKRLGYAISLTLEQFMSVNLDHNFNCVFTYALYSPVAGFWHGGRGAGEEGGHKNYIFFSITNM